MGLCEGALMNAAGSNEDNTGSVATDHAVAELVAARPCLRRDLRFTFQLLGGKPSYVLEDLTNRRYFQLGLAEYRFLIDLDGKRSAREVLARNARAMGASALSESRVQSLLSWLVENELSEAETAGQEGRRRETVSERESQKPARLLQNAFFMKIPLGNPDAFLNKIAPFLIWSLSPLAVVVWCGLLMYAGSQLLLHWRPFMETTRQVALPSNWIFLLLSFVGLKLVHELWHGIAAKRYQAPVSEWGVRLLALISPLTYIDATATWRLPDRSARMVVAAAGMYVEFFIAAIAVIVWVQTSPGAVNTMAYNVVFTASLVTLFFNGNPLMRFDGYYILSDWIQIPNLGSKGQQFVSWLGRKYLLGMEHQELSQSIKSRIVAIGIYGVLAAVWKVVIWVGIMIMVSGLFKGAGLVLVVLAVITGLVGMIKKASKLVFAGDRGVRISYGKTFTRVGGIFALVAAILIFVPVSPSPTLVAVVDQPGKALLRIDTDGFVRRVSVINGEAVQKGQLLASLENPIKSLELQRLQLDAARSRLISRKHLEAGNIAAHQAEEENLASLEEGIGTLQEEVDSLEIIAPIDGVIHADRLESLQGHYLRTGTIVMSVLPSLPEQLLVLIPQQEIEAFSRRQTENLSVKIRGRHGTFRAQLERIERQAKVNLPRSLLSSSVGGPLPVRQRPKIENDRERGLMEGRRAVSLEQYSAQDPMLAGLELATAHLLAYARLEPGAVREGEQLYEGEWGYAKLEGGQRYRLGAWLYDKLGAYLRERLEKVRDQSAT
ncbi:MAG: hypothetical protein L3J39_00275 [Verrucomicrobiales bacterium]|nr:hypothetical protein [Verrucomicrobiales bacterium]